MNKPNPAPSFGAGAQGRCHWPCWLGTNLATPHRAVPVVPERASPAPSFSLCHSFRANPSSFLPRMWPPPRWGGTAMAARRLHRRGRAGRGRCRRHRSRLRPPPWRPSPVTAAFWAASSAGPRRAPPCRAGLRGGSSAAKASRRRSPGEPCQRVRAVGRAWRLGRGGPVAPRGGSGGASARPRSPQTVPPPQPLNPLHPLWAAFSVLGCQEWVGRAGSSPSTCAGLGAGGGGGGV